MSLALIFWASLMSSGHAGSGTCYSQPHCSGAVIAYNVEIGECSGYSFDDGSGCQEL